MTIDALIVTDTDGARRLGLPWRGHQGPGEQSQAQAAPRGWGVGGTGVGSWLSPTLPLAKCILSSKPLILSGSLSSSP